MEEILELLLKASSAIEPIIKISKKEHLKLLPNSTVCIQHEDIRKKKIQYIAVCDGNGNFHFIDYFLTHNLIENIIQSAIDKKLSVKDAGKLVDILTKFLSHMDLDGGPEETTEQ